MLVSKSLLSVQALASKDDSRPLLTCVKLYREAGKIVSVATDSYVLGEVIQETPAVSEYPSLPSDREPTDPNDVLIPATVAVKLAKSIKKSNVLPVLNFGLVESDTATTTDLEETVTLSFKSPEGNYPDYRKLLAVYENKGHVTVTLDPKKIIQALSMFKDEHSVEFSIQIDPTTTKAVAVAPVFVRTNNGGIKKTAVIMPLKG